MDDAQTPNPGENMKPENCHQVVWNHYRYWQGEVSRMEQRQHQCPERQNARQQYWNYAVRVWV